MRFEIKMPDLATTESDIRVIRWMLEVGQKVTRGQPLVEIETDKANMEVESIADGVLSEILARPGESVAVGQAIAAMEVQNSGAAANPMASGAPAPSKPAAVTAPTRAPDEDRKRAGMFARNREAAIQKTPSAGAPATTKTQALSPAQRTAARRLLESKQTVPHFYLQTSVNAESMLARRRVAEPTKLAWDAFFVYAAARAVTRFQRLACRYENDQLVSQETDAVGVAVDHEGDLFVPAIASAAQKSPEQISQELLELVGRLRGGDAEARQLRPAWFTVTNLGMTGVEAFTPIINPPQASILGVGKVMPAIVVREDGSFEAEPRATLTLAVDHRVVSGRYAASFLDALVAELEAL